MHVLLVTYELNPGDNLEKIESTIEQYDSLRFSPTSYAVHTDLSAEALFQKLQPLLGIDDLVYVLTLGDAWTGYGYDAMNEWLKRNLG